MNIDHSKSQERSVTMSLQDLFGIPFSGGAILTLPDGGKILHATGLLADEWPEEYQGLMLRGTPTKGYAYYRDEPGEKYLQDALLRTEALLKVRNARIGRQAPFGY